MRDERSQRTHHFLYAHFLSITAAHILPVRFRCIAAVADDRTGIVGELNRLDRLIHEKDGGYLVEGLPFPSVVVRPDCRIDGQGDRRSRELFLVKLDRLSGPQFRHLYRRTSHARDG